MAVREGDDMNDIVRRRLPERLAGIAPGFLVEATTGLLAALVTVAARMPLDSILHEGAPYVFVFLGIVIASLLAGWRSGLVALVAGQTLTWYLIVEPRWSFAIAETEKFSGLVVGTVSQLLILGVIAVWQREIDRATREREERMRQALREIDHRTKNNYQTVLALMRLQAREAMKEETREALQAAAERIKAFALVSQQLAYRSEDLQVIRLGEHLRELCGQIRRGLSNDAVRIECEVEEVPARADKAIGISIIVNELISNALKHAFHERRRGTVQVMSRPRQDGLELVVSDDGTGMSAPSDFHERPVHFNGGLGSRLIESYVRQLGANHVVSSGDRGTRHCILVPSLA